MCRFFNKCITLFIFIFLIFSLTDAQVDEYVMKAVAIEKLARYIEWPSEASLGDTNVEFTITVIGKDPFNGVLEEIYSKRKIKNHNVIIKYVEDIKDIESSHLIFISGTVKKNVEQIIEYVKGRPTLLMGETYGYTEKGIHIRVFLENDRMKIEINEKCTIESGIKISSMILKLANIVNPLRK